MIGGIVDKCSEWKEEWKESIPRPAWTRRRPQWTRDINQKLPMWARFRKPKMNFIALHYIYLLSMTLIGSILIYPAGGISYTNALFFGSGASTQAGLNPVDVNTLKLYQQVVIMIIACITNPIFINTFVVFVRLYWFEKRFQNVVRDARLFRRTRERTRTKSEAKQDVDREEMGVGSRPITVVRNPDGALKGHKIDDEQEWKVVPNGRSSESSDTMTTPEKANKASRDLQPGDGVSPGGSAESPAFHRNIMFADEVRPSGSPQDGRPRIRDPTNQEQHITFVEQQRTHQDKGAYRIPGPRDFERGETVQRVESNEEDLMRKNSLDAEGPTRVNTAPELIGRHEINSDDHPVKPEFSTDETHGVRGKLRHAMTTFNFGHNDHSASDQDPSMTLRKRNRTKTFQSFLSSRSQERDPMPYLSWNPTVGRNSQFVGHLTEEQREELGGIEYRALKTLAWILIIYFVGFHLFGMVCLLPWIVDDKKYADVVLGDGVSPVWWGFWTPASMFNDLGFTLTPDSMISFQSAVWPLLVGTFLIVIGNTGFPCMLRFVIWVTSLYVPQGSSLGEELRFLLDHPRRCFTLLFPSGATWWLFAVLVILNGVDWILFIILDINDETVKNLKPGIRALDGLFQAASTRTAGFSAVNLANLHPAIQVSYLIMMYISVYPIAISVRRTNVYEEKSLGVYATADEEEENSGPEPSYIGNHLRRQLSFDLWYIFLGLFLIAIIEGDRLENTNLYAFTTFSVLFEIVSAYGTVGLSLGYPTINASFSAEFRTLSKLVIIAMMIRGRHRGLPYALDRAILLPSESLQKKEQEEAERRAGRRNSVVSSMDRPDMGQSSAFRAPALSRRGSSVAPDRRVGITRMLTGALSAGPTTHRRDKSG